MVEPYELQKETHGAKKAKKHERERKCSMREIEALLEAIVEALAFPTLFRDLARI